MNIDLLLVKLELAERMVREAPGQSAFWMSRAAELLEMLVKLGWEG